MKDLDKTSVDAVEKKIVSGHMPWCPSIAASEPIYFHIFLAIVEL